MDDKEFPVAGEPKPVMIRACQFLVHLTGEGGIWRVHNDGPDQIDVDPTQGVRTGYVRLHAGQSVDIWKGAGDKLQVHLAEDPGRQEGEPLLGASASGWFIKV